MVEIQFNYDFDIQGFFSGTEGTERRQTLEVAADFYEGFIIDNLSAINFGSGSANIGGNNGSNTWTARFSNPGTGANEQIQDLTVDEDTIIVYAGGRNISSLGRGGFGGFSVSGSSDFVNLIQGRSQGGVLTNPVTDFARWGGFITFDTDRNWHNTTDLGSLDSNEIDFLTVAIHELSHVFGFGLSTSWNNQIDNGNFTGSNSLAVYRSETDPNANSIPLQNDGAGHWTEGTSSLTREDKLQETSLDPDISIGTRKILTFLDYAGLEDVGWEVDFNKDVFLQGTINDDTLVGGGGKDTLNGGSGNDSLNGQDGHDNLRGNGNNDILSGRVGNDTLSGDGGKDILRGQGGRDVLMGGAGNDVLDGGADRDRFLFDTGKVFNRADLGTDRVIDFEIGSDKISLSKDTFTALDNISNSRLLNSDFEIVSKNSLAGSSSAEIVYNSNNGNLYYNPNNASAGFGNGGLFAKLIGSPNDLSNGDFQVIDVL